jgi:hypothetical protein
VGTLAAAAHHIPQQERTKTKKQITDMAKQRTAHAYELELRKMIEARTGAKMELWLMPQVRAAAVRTRAGGWSRRPSDV